MKVLLVGANGQLGRELLGRGTKKGFDLIPVDLPEFDISDPTQVEDQVFKSRPDLVINAAAYTAVDQAESEKDLAFAVNPDGPAHLAMACAIKDIPLIHVSTDYVFDGCQNRPYVETDPVCPMGVYGESKAAGERRIRQRHKKHIIIRTAWLYGIHGPNFVKTMIRLGKAHEKIRVVADQFGCPTHTADLADAIMEIAPLILSGRTVPWGTYHFCGKGKTTWHAFAVKIFELAERYRPMKVKEIMAITTPEYPTPAKRPTWSVMDCSEIESKFGIKIKAWDESLCEMIDCLFQSKNEDDHI